MLHRFRIRTLEPLRGSLASCNVALNRSSGSAERSSMMSLSRFRFAAKRCTSSLRCSFFSTALFFAMTAARLVLPERHAETLEQGLGLVVGLGRGADDDVHAPRLVDVVEVDLREHDLLADPEGVVASTVEALGRHAAEVAHPRERDVHEPVEELVHPLAPQRDLAADRHALAQLEVRDRLLRLADR